MSSVAAGRGGKTAKEIKVCNEALVLDDLGFAVLGFGAGDFYMACRKIFRIACAADMGPPTVPDFFFALPF